MLSSCGSCSEMAKRFTHKGWFLLCPVLIEDADSDCPYMETRRFIPEWWFSVNLAVVDVLLFGAFCLGFDAQYPILITGEISNGTSA